MLVSVRNDDADAIRDVRLVVRLVDTSDAATALPASSVLSAGRAVVVWLWCVFEHAIIGALIISRHGVERAGRAVNVVHLGNRRHRRQHCGVCL